MRPFLKDLIGAWLKTEPKLQHFYIRQLMTDFIMCECIDHAWGEYSQFIINRNNVEVSWPPHWPIRKFESILLDAANPNFFDKLKCELIKVCEHAK